MSTEYGMGNSKYGPGGDVSSSILETGVHLSEQISGKKDEPYAFMIEVPDKLLCDIPTKSTETMLKEVLSIEEIRANRRHFYFVS